MFKTYISRTQKRHGHGLALDLDLNEESLRGFVVPEVEDGIRKRYRGMFNPPDTFPYTAPFRDLFVSHVVFEEAQKALI
jgi:hypothetical protein